MTGGRNTSSAGLRIAGRRVPYSLVAAAAIILGISVVKLFSSRGQIASLPVAIARGGMPAYTSVDALDFSIYLTLAYRLFLCPENGAQVDVSV